MKIALIGRAQDIETNDFFIELSNSLQSSSQLDVKPLSGCLCYDFPLRDFDVIINHPCDSKMVRDRRPESCWTAIKNNIEHYKDKQFYVLAINNPERKIIIGEHPNLIYLDEQNSREFFSAPTQYILEHRLKG
jgi:hypothetical protein